MERKMKVMFLLIGIMVLAAGMSKIVLAEDADDKVAGAVLSVLSSTKHTLADGIKQAAQGTQVPVSAKFEMDDGKLSLSVYTAEKGLNQDAEHNTFREVAGDPTAETWSPKSEMIKEGNDLKDAKQQLAVLSNAKVTLADIVDKATKENQGTAIAAIPEQEENQSVIEIKLANNGKISEHHYDIVSGNEVKVEEGKEDKY